MYPATIEAYHRPGSIDEALEAIASAGDDAFFIAGGQSLMQSIKSRLVQPSCLVDLQDVTDLKGVNMNGGVNIGAMTRYVELAGEASLAPAFQAICDAAGHVGDRQVRNRGTIGGSLCWNYIAACMPAVALGLGASLELASSEGRRTLAADEFLGAPFETARRDDELLVSISLPAPPKRAGSAYKKWSLLTDGLPVVGVCVYVELDDAGTCALARVAFSGLTAGPQRSEETEAKLVGHPSDDEESIAQAMAAAASRLGTQSDLWADAAYRSHLISTLGAEVATTAFGRAAP